ncbi:NmrA family NAD(P)-binding protein [Mangrovivirga sp. M17]|uniref:NmrA family NAD(P)-binding protein n=1 Tax=Mangrovivirga halotolerans TaxID=2993936 RepID=A0ABT3RW45_9BACT|nr:NmrA family NAD(P)-binding protein [Mangrovivirga halotolerans]MCX2745991.1 NmrA family NAD(P)-binding protein [Mangrovivirga halotolerans]
MIKTIAVFGATGMLGVPVVKELINEGFHVRALVRDIEKAKRLLPHSVEFITGNLKNEQDIENTLVGAQGVYMNLSVKPEDKKNQWLAEREGLKSIIKKSKIANIQRIALCSSLVKNHNQSSGFHWWVFDIKEDAVNSIKTCGIPFTIFYPSSFMENFDKGDYVQDDKIMLAGESKYPMYFIAGEDYGKQVAYSFKKLLNENKHYPVQGLEAFTADQAAEIFKKNYPEKDLSIKKMPIGLLWFLSLFSAKMNYIYKIITALNKYPEKFESETTWKELGKPSITLEEYSRKASLKQ